MTQKAESVRARRILGATILVLGCAAMYISANSFISWGMILGSGIDLGGESGERWLLNITEGLVALGVIIAGRLLDRGKLLLVPAIALPLLTFGVCVGWLWHESAMAVLVGLGIIASFGAGMLLALSIFTVMTRAGVGRGIMLGIVFALGIFGVEFIWGAASMFTFSRGADWVLSQVLWIGPCCGVIGVGAMMLALRLGVAGEQSLGKKFPLFGPQPTTISVRASESPSFLILAALALLTGFIGLMAQKAGAALSLIGTPADSFAAGVLVGFTFAICRAFGALGGGIIQDVLGAKVGVMITGLGLALTMIILSRHTGYENPWHLLIGSIGVACGLGLTVVPAACASLFGRDHFGYHLGLLYLSIALGNVIVLPLVQWILNNPATSLLLTATLSVTVALSALWLRSPRPEPAD